MVAYYLIEAIYRPYAYLANNDVCHCWNGKSIKANANTETPLVNIKQKWAKESPQFQINMTVFGYKSGRVTWFKGDNKNVPEGSTMLSGHTDLTPEQINEITEALRKVTTK